MQMTAWGIGFLDWNARWVVGYRGTNDVMLALERGEVDMTATANLFQLQKLVETGKVKLLAQTGVLKNGVTVTRPEFPDVPTLATLLEGRIKDPLVTKAFDLLERHRRDGQVPGAAAAHAAADARRLSRRPLPRRCRTPNSPSAARR